MHAQSNTYTRARTSCTLVPDNISGKRQSGKQKVNKQGTTTTIEYGTHIHWKRLILSFTCTSYYTTAVRIHTLTHSAGAASAAAAIDGKAMTAASAAILVLKHISCRTFALCLLLDYFYFVFTFCQNYIKKTRANLVCVQ